MLTILPEDPGTPEVSALLRELSEVLKSITGDSGSASFDLNDVRLENAKFVVARDQVGNAVGCGAFRPLEQGIAEVKRMYSRRSLPGIGSAILAVLEKEAVKLGYTMLRLETRVVNERAVNFYERLGFYRIQNFGRYAGKAEAACFEKLLVKP
jgi:GNAT superfamily N-acetyltransferase